MGPSMVRHFNSILSTLLENYVFNDFSQVVKSCTISWLPVVNNTDALVTALLYCFG